MLVIQPYALMIYFVTLKFSMFIPHPLLFCLSWMVFKIIFLGLRENIDISEAISYGTGMLSRNYLANKQTNN